MSDPVSEPAETPTQPAPGQYLLTPSAPVTAATSVQTFAPMDDEKTDMASPSENPGEASPQMEEQQTGASLQAPAADAQAEAPVPQTPQTSLTFLQVTGSRRTMSFDPETTIGRVKELVWNTWPSEWQSDRPPAPSFFRILHLGKILQDEDTLSKLSFPASTPPATIPPTIVHLSIRPSFMAAEVEDPALKKKFRRGLSRTASSAVVTSPTPRDAAQEEDTHSGCCCIIC